MRTWAIVEQTEDFRLRTVRTIKSELEPKVKLQPGQRLMVKTKPVTYDPKLAFPSAWGLGIKGDPEA